MFHLSSKVFRPKEFMNPLVELRNTGIVFSAEVHTVIMAAILNPVSSSAKKNRQAEGLFMRYLAGILITLFLTIPAISVELFRYRGAAKDSGTLEYAFYIDEQDVPENCEGKKMVGTAADFMSSYCGIQFWRLRNFAPRRFHFG
jgi:hypothetical protein